MKYLEFYFTMKYYIFIGFLILLGLFVAFLIISLIFTIIKEKLEKFQNKILNRENKEGEQNDT